MQWARQGRPFGLVSESHLWNAGVGLGLESTAMPVLVISAAITSAYWLGKTSGLQDSQGLPVGGLFGTAVATMGMLSTAGYVLTMDMFGPIADNAGGIVEMSQQVWIQIVMVIISCSMFHNFWWNILQQIFLVFVVYGAMDFLSWSHDIEFLASYHQLP